MADMAMPEGMKKCSMNGTAGFSGGGACHVHDGTPAGMKAAMAKAKADMGKQMSELETVTLEGVEILEANVTVHGVGSPPEGDRYTPADLSAMAQAAHELEAAGEWRVPMKIDGDPLGRAKLGHGKEQTLLAAGEMPAAGWLTNQRVSADGLKLLADVADVPRKVADLIRAKAYRQRSSELSSVTSQRTGKRHPWVVSGLGFLGGKMPAVRTLDEIHALYSGEDAERLFVHLTDIDAPSVDELRDLIAALGSDLVSVSRAVADIPADMDDAKTFTAEQRKAFSTATGLEEAKVTDEMLAAAGVAETPAPDPTPDPETDPKLHEAFRSLEARVETEATARRELEAKLAKKDADTWLEHDVLRAGKADPGQADEIRAMYEQAPEQTRKFFANVPANETLAREYGADSDVTEEELEANEKQYEADAAARFGLDPVEVL